MTFPWNLKPMLMLFMASLFSSMLYGNSLTVPDTACRSLESKLTVQEKQRIDSILKVLTLEEKAYMLHGSGLFTSGGVERFGLRELTYADGPSGIREEVGRTSWAPLNWQMILQPSFLQGLHLRLPGIPSSH
jgi:hypothetical protein